jgi:hypothetical protein
VSAQIEVMVDDDLPRFYVPAGGSVVALVAINDTPAVREAAVGIADLVTGGVPSLVVVDYRVATIVTLDLAQIDEARRQA